MKGAFDRSYSLIRLYLRFPLQIYHVNVAYVLLNKNVTII